MCESSISQIAVISTLGSALKLLMWFLPRPPTPTTAIRNVSLGLPKTLDAAVKAPAEVTRKCLRCMNRPPPAKLSYFRRPATDAEYPETQCPVPLIDLALRPLGPAM